MSNDTPRKLLLALKIVTMGPVVVMLLFSAVVYYLHTYNNFGGTDELIPTFLWIVPAAMIVCLLASLVVFKAAVGRILKDAPLDRKLQQYQTATLVRLALVEVPGLLGGVAALLTGYLYFLVAPLAVALIMYFLRPTPFTVAADLLLSDEEKSLLK